MYEPYKTGSKRGKFTLYVMPNTSYTSDYDSAIDFLYYNSDKTAEMELRYYFGNISTEGKLIEYKLGSQNDFIIIDPSMAYMQFIDGCRISGDSVASILSEGGYIRSSVFWQYKSKMYSALFIDPIAELSQHAVLC